MATKKTVVAKPVSEAPKATVTTVKTIKSQDVGSADTIKIMLAEFIGTFILAMVAITAAFSLPLYLGLALVFIVMLIGSISGAHVNPAVTFGLWVAGRIKAAVMPFYIIAQLLGAMAALVLTNYLQPQVKFSTDFVKHFTEMSTATLAIEVIGTAIFVLGIVLITGRKDVSNSAKAAGVGLSLMIAVIISSVLFSTAMTNSKKVLTDAQAKNPDSKETPKLDRVMRTGGATLNPAVALVGTEKSMDDFQQNPMGPDTSKPAEAKASRFGLESILGTFIGAGIGGYLGVILGRRNRL